MASVRIARSDGELGTIDEADLPAALESGFRQVNDDEAAAIKTRREAQSTTGMARGLAESVGSGVSFGITDNIQRNAGGDMEAFAARRENLGDLGRVAEVAGAIAPALLSGGTGALGAAARLTPAGRVAMLGKGAAQGVEAAIGTSALARVGAGAVGAGIEGAFAGAGGALTEAALGDRDVAAESILAGATSTAGVASLFGGGAATLGLGLERAYAGSQRVSPRLVGEALGGVDDIGTKAGQAAARGDSVLAKAVEWQTKLVGGSDGQVAAAQRNLSRTRTAAGRDLLDLAGRPQSVIDREIGERIGASAGKSSTRSAVKAWERNLSSSAKAGKTGAARARDQLDSWLTTARKRPAEAGLETALSAETTKRVRKLLQAGDMAASPAAAHRWMARASSSVDDVIADLRLAGSPDALALESLAGPLRAMADDGALWGKKGSRGIYAAQAAEDAALSGLPKNVRRALNGESHSPTGLRDHAQGIEDVLKARSSLADTLEGVGEDVSELRRGIEDVRSAMKHGDDLAGAADDIRLVTELDQGPGATARTALKYAGSGVGAVVGGMSFGGVALGKLAGHVIGAATQPAAAIRTIARVRGGLAAVQARQSGAVKAFAGLADGTAKAGRAVARGAGTAAKRVSPQAARKAQAGRHERLIEKMRRVTQLASDPMKLAEEMGAATEQLRVAAPDVTNAVIAGAARAAAYLASVAPPVYKPTFGGGVAMVDPFELDAFERRMEAVEDPMGTLDRLGTGTMTHEHAEALAAVYPRVFESLQGQILEIVGEREANGKPVSFAARTAIGLLGDVITDDSLRPKDYAEIQASMQREDAGQQPSGPAPKAIEAPPLSKWQRMETQA